MEPRRYPGPATPPPRTTMTERNLLPPPNSRPRPGERADGDRTCGAEQVRLDNDYRPAASRRTQALSRPAARVRGPSPETSPRTPGRPRRECWWRPPVTVCGPPPRSPALEYLEPRSGAGVALACAACLDAAEPGCLWVCHPCSYDMRRPVPQSGYPSRSDVEPAAEWSQVVGTRSG